MPNSQNSAKRAKTQSPTPVERATYAVDHAFEDAETITLYTILDRPGDEPPAPSRIDGCTASVTFDRSERNAAIKWAAAVMAAGWCIFRSDDHRRDRPEASPPSADDFHA
jgi:hypothetical protein